MEFAASTGISAITVFIQGLLSFFSPCVLPLLPVYIGYLSGGTMSTNSKGVIQYAKKKILINTLFFIVGISFAFFLLGLGFTAIGQFFNDYRSWIVKIGGILIILFGMYQLFGLGGDLLGKEHKLPFHLKNMALNPWTALLLGFTFSFAWTPCVGPALTSVLLMASSTASAATGFLLIGLYTLGFVIPFLGIGFFTGALLSFIKKHQQVVRYTVKIGGVLMVIMGLLVFTGWSGGINEAVNESAAPDKTSEENQTQLSAAPDFTLTDQYGKQHSLSEYKGKTIFLNFWATWCGPCKQEMPDIQRLYEEYNKNSEDVIILGIANPSDEKGFGNREGTTEDIKAFLKKNGYTYPVVMDTTGALFQRNNISAFPTTFMINKDGNIFGYISGALSFENMQDIIRQTKENKIK